MLTSQLTATAKNAAPLIYNVMQQKQINYAFKFYIKNNII